MRLRAAPGRCPGQLAATGAATARLHRSCQEHSVDGLLVADALEAQARAVLLEQKQAFTNWERFATANNVSGWDGAAPLCSWSGVECSDGASLQNGWSL